jgi:mannose-6-phosphate isomerase-like protein (cupin superfamily)
MQQPVPRAQIVHPDLDAEVMTEERCAILESWNTPLDPDVSIARARVAPGSTTQRHTLDVDERYIVIEGEGIARIGDLEAETVMPGDIVFIPAETPQQITNHGTCDLVIYCVCSPRFTAESYTLLE